VITARRTARMTLAVALAAVLLALPVASAMAEDPGVPAPSATIAAGVVVGGVDLSGLTASDAEATLTANVVAPTLAPLSVEVTQTGSVFKLNALTAVDLDAAGLVSEALAATSAVEIPARYTVNAPVVYRFVIDVARHTNLSVVSTKRKIVKRRLKLTKSRTGLKVYQGATASAIATALTAELAAGGAEQPAVAATVKVTQPKTTSANIGKTIVVVLRERRLYLYKGGKLEKKYRCAVGQSRYPTPKGTWKIVRKVKNPSWYNNGAGWASNMPSHIGPGLNNPLGTRALYLNASGIRIHGIPSSENGSIGRAASHGCIRLKNSNAVDLYPRVKVGTPVYIVG
jgi:lipoprotein-anchoring transpeptidase ErfK/SrfK